MRSTGNKRKNLLLKKKDEAIVEREFTFNKVHVKLIALRCDGCFVNPGRMQKKTLNHVHCTSGYATNFKLIHSIRQTYVSNAFKT